MPRIFVSHSHQDNEYCRAFVQELHDLGATTWYDENDLGAGEVHNSIEDGMPTCDCFVVILTPASVQSRWVKREIGAAIKLEDSRAFHLVPIIAEPCDVPGLLNDYKHVEGSPKSAAREALFLLSQADKTGAGPKYEVKVARSTTDRDLDQFFALYEGLFKHEEERASREDMVRYVAESQEERAKPEPDYLEELVLVKHRGNVIAFLNYTFYYAPRYVFVSYVGNKSSPSKSPEVMGALLTHFRDTMVANRCRAVVFEVESKVIKPKGEQSRIKRFRDYLQDYMGMKDSNCYAILFNFIQPYLAIDEVKDAPGGISNVMARLLRASSATSDMGVSNWLSLGIVPLERGIVTGAKIGKDALMSVLEFVYRNVYGDSFIDDPEDDKKYKAYMERLLRYYRRTLPPFIDVRAQGTT